MIVRAVSLYFFLAGGVFVCHLGSAAPTAPPRYLIETVAGTGKPGWSGDGGPAVEAQLDHPTAVAVDSSGNLYVADFKNHRVRRIDEKAIITTIAGHGTEHFEESDALALETAMTQVYGIAVGADGRVYALRRTQPKLFRLDPDGMARTVAGTGQPGYAGDGGPATAASLASPNHLVVATDGTIYIADSGNAVLRKVSPAGTITTYAGTGERGFGGDGGPAVAARFDGPSAIALDATGALYVADFENHRIRKITPDGNVTTVAGTGEPRYNGDGIAATSANIGEPTGVAVDTRGWIYIADQINNRIRLVTADGVVHTIAGTGRIGRPVDGAAAEESSIFIPDILCVDQAGVVYFPDHQNNAVRKLTPVAAD